MDSRMIDRVVFDWLQNHEHSDIIHAGWCGRGEDAIQVSLFVRGRMGMRSTRRKVARCDLHEAGQIRVAIHDAMDSMYAQLVEGIETYG